jgi:hypothetical protein
MVQLLQEVEKSRAKSKRLALLVIGAVGYILSPLSPWNDTFVNVPIAVAVAKMLHSLAGLNEVIGFQIGYLTSNILGIAMMLVAYDVGRMGQVSTRRLMKLLAASLVYSLAAAAVLTALGVLSAS